MPAAYPDFSKSANDLLTKDFYHVSQTALEFKTRAPNGVQFVVSGKSDHKGDIGGKLEAKYADKQSGLNLTQSWLHSNSLDSKVELDNALAQGLKAEVTTRFNPASAKKAAEAGLLYTQPSFMARAYLDLLRGPAFRGNLSVGQQGFMAGGEVKYDVVDGRITGYSAAVGYSIPEYTATITSDQKLSVFSAAYHHRVNAQVEAAAKAVWDSNSTDNTVALELATKYAIDRDTFTKVRARLPMLTAS